MQNSDIVVCIPAYNEEAVIAESVRTVAAATADLSGVSIVVVENGSTDNTRSTVEQAGVENASVISIAKKGKGAAVLRGATYAREVGAEIFVFIDADLSADPHYIPEFVHALDQKSADIVIGSRLLDQSGVHRGAFRTMTSQFFNMVRSALFTVPVKDAQCGLKAMNKRAIEVLLQCTEEGWFLDTEFLAHAHRAGLRISEQSIVWEEEKMPGRKSKLSLIRDGFGMIRAFYRIRQRLSKKQV